VIPNTADTMTDTNKQTNKQVMYNTW